MGTGGASYCRQMNYRITPPNCRLNIAICRDIPVAKLEVIVFSQASM
jgi:hypothetical protein